MSRRGGENGKGAEAAPLRRIGVSGRLLGAIVVPVLVLAVTLGASVVREHDDVRRSEVVSEQVVFLRQLVELRSAVFRERLAVEIFVPSRRPPPELLKETEFGAQIAEAPEQLGQRTNAALAAIEPDDRPFSRAVVSDQSSDSASRRCASESVAVVSRSGWPFEARLLRMSAATSRMSRCSTSTASCMSRRA